MNANKNLNAFTLIELLAVIVILAIIAIIAIPIILGIINDSKEKAFRVSLKNVEHAYSLYVAKHQEDANFDKSKEISIKELPLDTKNLTGKVVMNEDGELELKDITDGTYCAKGTKNNLNIIKGSCDELGELETRVNINKITSDSITIVVETIKGTPTSYSYTITGPNNYKDNKNDSKDNTYTFIGLKPGNYIITIIARNNKASVQAKTTGTIEKLTLDKPEINYTEELKTYTQGGKITIEYPDTTDENIEKVYRWDDWDEERFEEYTGEIEARNETIIAIVRYKDTKELVVESDKTITNIDNEGPKINSSNITDYDTVTIEASDEGSDLPETPYKCDDGSWQSSKKCIFETGGLHKITVQDSLGNTTEASVRISLLSIEEAPSDTLGLIKIMYYNPTTGKACNKIRAVSTTGTKNGCMKWYVYKEFGGIADNSSDEYYFMILDHNTTAQVAYNSANSNSTCDEACTQLNTDTSGWSSQILEKRFISADEIANITDNKSFKELTTKSSGWFYFDSNSQTQTVNESNPSKYHWLFDYLYNCKSLGGCKTLGSGWGYWTSSKIYGTTNLVWRVGSDGYLDGTHNSNASNTSYGIRPVIKIRKVSK